jgi:hypothetical protein
MIGRSLGRYTVEPKLGEGGMGIVFREGRAASGRSSLSAVDSAADELMLVDRFR